MQEKKEYLNEENYQRSKKKITKIALIILIVGLLIGGSLIATGIIKKSKVNANYSSENKANLQKEIDAEKINLENKKAELETKRSEALKNEKNKLESKKAELKAKGIVFDSFTKYDDGESYDLKIITNVLDPSFDRCGFDEYKNNTLTSAYCLIVNKQDDDYKNLRTIDNALNSSFNQCTFGDTKNNSYTAKYCSLKAQLNEKNDFNKSFDSYNSVPLFIFGTFVIISSCIVAGSIYMFSKRREMLAFSAQQIMPVAQEGIEKMTPTIGKAGASIAKEMAPVYGNIAKEISKGIKEGVKEGSKDKDNDQKEN